MVIICHAKARQLFYKVFLFKKMCRSGVFIVNFEHISHLVLVFLLLTLNRQMPAGKRVFL